MKDLLRKLGATRKRVIFGVIAGLIVLFALIWVKSNLYDPFAEEFQELLVFVPDDADAIVHAPDFPTLVKGLEDRPFFTQLDRSKNFRQFLASDLVKETELIPKLREAYNRLTEIDAELPFDLQALGDLSGEEVVLSIFEPKVEGGDFTVVAAVQPESDLALTAARAVINPTISSWIEDSLGAQKVEHSNWGVVLTFLDDKNRPVKVGLACVERVLLVGTEIDAIAKMVKKARVDGIPIYPPQRMEPGWVWSDLASSAINFAARAEFLLKRVELHKNFLIPMWGGDIARAFEKAFPSFSSRDFYLQLNSDTDAALRVAVGAKERSPVDVFSLAGEIDEGEASLQIDNVVGNFPYHVFGYGAYGCHPADLVAFALRERAMVDQDQKELLFAGLSELKSFAQYKNPNGKVKEFVAPFTGKLRSLFEPGIGLVLFKKEREGESEDSSPGVACILKIANEELVEEFIEELDVGLKQPFTVYEEADELKYWRVSKKAFLDNPEDNDPGFAIMGGGRYLVVTNWCRLFPETVEVMNGRMPGMPLRDQLDYRVSNLVRGARGFFFVDVKRLYAHMDQAKKGWIIERTKIEEVEKFAKRNRLHQRWKATKPPLPEEEWVDQQYRVWLTKVKQERNASLVSRNIERNLDYFRDTFSQVFLAVGQEGAEFRFELTISTQEN